MLSLLENIKATFSRPLIGHVAARLGEGESSINKALDGIVPIVLGGLINKAGAGDAESVYELSLSACNGTYGSLSNMTGLLGVLGSGSGAGSAMTQGEKLLGLLFGPSGRTLAGPVSDYAGIKRTSASTLLGMAGAVLPALLGSHATRHNLQARGLASALTGLKSQVQAMLPPDLQGLSGLVWLSGLGSGAMRHQGARYPFMLAQHGPLAAEADHRWWQALMTMVGCAALFAFYFAFTNTAGAGRGISVGSAHPAGLEIGGGAGPGKFLQP